MRINTSITACCLSLFVCFVFAGTFQAYGKTGKTNHCSGFLYDAHADLDVKKSSSQKLLVCVAEDYKKDPVTTVALIEDPAGPYSSIADKGDSHVAYIDAHGRYYSPKYPNAKNIPLFFHVSPKLDKSNPSSKVQTGQKLLEAKASMVPGEQMELVVPSNFRPSTGKPAQANAMLYKNKDGSILLTAYFTFDLPQLKPDETALRMAGQ